MPDKPKKKQKDKDEPKKKGGEPAAEAETPQPWDASTPRRDLPLSRLARKGLRKMKAKTLGDAAVIRREEWVAKGLSPMAFAEVQMIAAAAEVHPAGEDVDAALVGDTRKAVAALVRKIAERDAIVGNDREVGYAAIANGDPALHFMKLFRGSLEPAYREAYDKARGERQQ